MAGYASQSVAGFRWRTGAAGRSVPHWISASRLIARLLRFPLFLKLFVANAAILLLIGTGTALLATRTVTLWGLGPALSLQVLAVVALVLSGFANAFLIRLALSPLAGLEEAALRVQQGDSSARAPDSPLADEDLARVIALFNQVLDCADQDRARRRELAHRVLEAEERERERLGHALYAGTAQTLAGVLVRMKLVKRIRDVEQGVAMLEEVRDEVARALEEVRRLARRLHPPELSELGVAAALEAHARYLVEDRDVRVGFDGKVPEGRLSPDARLVLFRIAQEALSNAVVHSGGSVVQTRFESTAAGLEAEVSDDGSGFDPDQVLLSGQGGLGLLGMRERAGYVSAKLSIDSAPGRGTRVRVLIPWSASANAETAPASADGAPPEAAAANPAP